MAKSILAPLTILSITDLGRERGARARSAARSICIGLAASAAVVMASCARDTRGSIPESELLTQRSAYFEKQVEQADGPQRGLVDRLTRERAAFDRGETAAPPTLNILILSGGGDLGAFGAGFLKGWGRVAQGDAARPTFDAVTGVSTGALIAPFAFVGDDKAYERIDLLYRNPKPEWLSEHGLLSFLLNESPYYDITGLEKEIRGGADMALVSQIAAGARQGRALAVGATNIDYGVRRAFVLSEMAVTAESTGDPGAIQDAILASSAIPIAFPPREIDGCLYVDGGLTSNILFSGDPQSPRGFTAAWRAANPALPMPRIRYWVIVNNQMMGPPAVVQPRWSSVGGPTVDTAIRASTAASLRELSLLVRLQCAAGIDSQFRWVCIPPDWRAPVKGMFEPETMRSLADLGNTMGGEPGSWRTEPLGD